MTITAENLCKRFNREWIFRDFNYHFQTGTYAITGPNGSGKSTLLQVLWGQVPATSGTMLLSEAGVQVAEEDLFKHVSIAAPYVELMEELTLEEAIRFHFSFKKVRKEIGQDSLLDRMELTHARGKQVGHFSSGMKQRLKLGLALFSDVGAVFLDEPTTNLDTPSIAWYWRNFEQIEGKACIFIASNHPEEYPATAIKVHLPDYKGGYK